MLTYFTPKLSWFQQPKGTSQTRKMSGRFLKWLFPSLNKSGAHSDFVWAVRRERNSKIIALTLLLSLFTGLMAPAVVAMSKDELNSAVQTQELPSKVKDFFLDALEDALTRSVSVAHISVNSPNRVSEGSRLLFVLTGSVDFNQFPTPSIFSPTSDLDVEADYVDLKHGTAGVQPLGP